MPELVNPAPNCRLCRLVKTHPNVVFVVHELYRRGLRGATLAGRLVPVFEEAEQAQPNAKSLESHLSSHCVFDSTTEAITDYETDYTELRQLYTEFRAIFQDVRQEFGDKKTQGEKTSDHSLAMLVRLASELRQMLRTLADMRNNEKLFNVVLVKHTELLVQLLAEPLGLTLRDVRDRVTRGSAASAEQVLTRLLDGEIYPIFQTASKEALERSRQQYKLS